MLEYVKILNSKDLNPDIFPVGGYGIYRADYGQPDQEWIAIESVNAIKMGWAVEYLRSFYPPEIEWMPEGFEPDWTPNLYQYWYRYVKYETPWLYGYHVVYYAAKGEIKTKFYPRQKHYAMRFADQVDGLLMKNTYDKWELVRQPSKDKA